MFTLREYKNIPISHGYYHDPDSKVPGANMGPIWGRQDPGGSHVCPLNFAIMGLLTTW